MNRDAKGTHRSDTPAVMPGFGQQQDVAFTMPGEEPSALSRRMFPPVNIANQATTALVAQRVW